MAKAHKLPSGRWRCQAYLGKDENGKKITKSFTADTKKEAQFLASECVHSGMYDKNTKVQKAIYQYIQYHTSTYSPNTIRTYTNMLKTAYNDILNIPITNLDNVNLSAWVNNYSKGRNPKSVKNAFSLLRAACKMQGVVIPSVRMPQEIQVEYNLPTDAEVIQIIDHFRQRGDQEMVVAIMLGAYGLMRRGEICALKRKDFKNNTCHISKTMSLNENREWVVKVPKNVSSDRYIELPPFVMAEIPQKDPIFVSSPDAIDHRFTKACKRLGMDYHFHLLRHYGTSVLAANNVPDVLLQRMGGWSSDKVLKNVYRNVMPEYMKEAQKLAIEVFEKLQ